MAIKVTLAVVVIVGVCAILAAMMIGRPESGDKQTAPESVRPEATVWNGGNWPMFHGGQGLLGRAPGTLPDSLTVVWKFKTDDQIKSSPAIVDGLVFIGSSDANMYAIDLEDGHQVWAYKTPDAIEATPCVAEGSVYVGCSDGFLYALDAKTGSFKWKYETEGEILGAANWTRSPDGRSLWILVGSYDNRLHCVDSTSGKAVWTYETDNYINGSPAVDDQKTVFGGCDALIHVVSLADGSEVAQIDSGSYIAASAAFLEGQVYVGNYDNMFIRADIAAGKIVWEYAGSDSPFFSSPAIGEDVVVVGGRDKRVHCIGRDDGKVVWTFQTLGEVDSSPVICGDKVVVGSEDGRLYLIRLSDGSKVWSHEVGQAVTSSPAVVGGMVVVGCDDGYVYAFGATR
ncbi:MAG: outer membrane protein assembly factor BamB family protein [Planctomycetota bacterium]|jgi:outer membrane protein assembly factor BamB